MSGRISTADRLREAAALLRERAEETHDGPWDHVVSASGDHAWVERRNIETVVRTHDNGTSAYIAMMHPPVALALAEMLEGDAEAVDGIEDHFFEDGWMKTVLAVADAILGGDREAGESNADA